MIRKLNLVASILASLAFPCQLLGQTTLSQNSVGTPGTGSIYISGSPQTYTFDSCPPQYGGCPVTVPDSGSITATLNGQSYTMSYGGSETGSQIATNLASAINSGSSGGLPLFSVVANGTTISITSLLKGAATNYSLSASSTYNPSCTTANGQTYCFTSPAFTASASGSSLTGGAN